MWEGRAERKQKDNMLPLRIILWQTDIQRLTDHEDEAVTDSERQNKTVGKAYLFPLCHPSLPIFLSFSLFFLFPLIAFVEERRQTRTEAWTQTPVNTFTFFLLQLFSALSLPSIICYTRSSLQVVLYQHSFHTVWGPTRSHYTSVMSLVLLAVHDLLMPTLIHL